MTKLHVGQRVSATNIDHFDHDNTAVLEGIITKVGTSRGYEGLVLINFGAHFDGHDGDSENGTMWWVEKTNVTALPDTLAAKRGGQQTDRILSHLLSGKSITQLEAFGVYRIFRLAARIHELKQKGHKIETTMRTDATGKSYAEYSLRTTRSRAA